ncbi:type II secretion system protein GspL [Pseudoalteromonas rubra]|uniref:type II secretion system protein GspL n=1 Tax=Pseudoalteromonas rubra TaxID=43658 RepID=UPI000F7A3CE9|nr:type II secretion system protein GspL [Pseudoalteromonas rubra]
MSEKLMIRVGHSQQEPVHWLVWSAQDAQIIASGELEHAGLLGELSEKAQNRSVAVLLPASSVQLKTIDLPAKWNRKLEQALPFMLEEQIACDIDKAFIAVGKAGQRDEQHTIDVALCDKAWLTGWMALFEDFDISVQRLLPDALLLPEPAQNAISAIELGTQWLFRTADWQVSGVEPDWLAGYLSLLPAERIQHYSPGETLGSAKSLEAMESEYDLPLALFAKQLEQQSFNLRQGKFAAKKKQPQWWRDWQSGLIAASVALVCFVAVKSTQLLVLQNQADELSAQAIASYKQAFPNKVVRPHLLKKQIQNELNSLSGDQQGGFLELTNHFVTVFDEVKDFEPETLRYDQRRNELRIRAKANGFQVFGQVKSILEQRGMTVQQGALNNDGDYVIGEIRIRGAA